MENSLWDLKHPVLNLKTDSGSKKWDKFSFLDARFHIFLLQVATPQQLSCYLSLAQISFISTWSQATENRAQK